MFSFTVGFHAWLDPARAPTLAPGYNSILFVFWSGLMKTTSAATTQTTACVCKVQFVLHFNAGALSFFLCHSRPQNLLAWLRSVMYKRLRRTLLWRVNPCHKQKHAWTHVWANRIYFFILWLCSRQKCCQLTQVNGPLTQYNMIIKCLLVA